MTEKETLLYQCFCKVFNDYPEDNSTKKMLIEKYCKDFVLKYPDKQFYEIVELEKINMKIIFNFPSLPM